MFILPTRLKVQWGQELYLLLLTIVLPGLNKIEETQGRYLLNTQLMNKWFFLHTMACLNYQMRKECDVTAAIHALLRSPHYIIVLCIPVQPPTHSTHNSEWGFSLATGAAPQKWMSGVLAKGCSLLATAPNQYMTGVRVDLSAHLMVRFWKLCSLHG